jgi:thioredoxin reductase (NADPH)
MPAIAIIGSGPAGYTAAIYTARANLSPVLFTGMQAGGQLTTTTDVENFPGFPEGVMGPELMTRMEQQASRFGTQVKMGCEVHKVEPVEGGFRLTWNDLYQGQEDSEVFAAVIVATGASAKYLGLPGEEGFLDGTGKKTGLTACATCDGAFYRDVPVAVVGGGDTAAEEGTFLTRFASKVYLIHRRDQLRASKVMADRVLGQQKVEPCWNKVPIGYITNEHGKMTALRLRDTTTDEESQIDVAGVFMAIGHKPNTDFLAGSDVEMDEAGYIKVQGGCRTSVPGIFAAGDVRDTVYRQAVTAAGMGCMAALEAERYVESLAD